MLSDADFNDAEGEICPYCHSTENVEYGGIEVTTQSIEWPASCQTCGKSWITLFELAGYSPND